MQRQASLLESLPGGACIQTATPDGPGTAATSLATPQQHAVRAAAAAPAGTDDVPFQHCLDGSTQGDAGGGGSGPAAGSSQPPLTPTTAIKRGSKRTQHKLETTAQPAAAAAAGDVGEGPCQSPAPVTPPPAAAAAAAAAGKPPRGGGRRGRRAAGAPAAAAAAPQGLSLAAEQTAEPAADTSTGPAAAAPGSGRVVAAVAAKVAVPVQQGSSVPPKKKAPTRRPRNSAAAVLNEQQPDALGSGPATAAAAAAAAATPAAAPKGRQRKRKQPEPAAAADDAAGDDSAAPTEAAAGGNRGRGRAGAADRGKAKRTRTATQQQQDEQAADAAAGDDAAPAAAAAAASKPPKPVRRTKKVIAAEVAAAARSGVFGQLTDLSGSFSHVALFTSSSNTTAWAALVQEAAPLAGAADDTAAAGAGAGGDGSGGGGAGAGAGSSLEAAAMPAAAAPPTDQAAGSADQQHQQQQQLGGRSASSQALCRTSGLGSFRQQVWLHSQSQDPSTATPPPPGAAAAPGNDDSDAAPAAGGSTGSVDATTEYDPLALPLLLQQQQQWPLTEEQRAQQLRLLPNLGYACLCSTMRRYDVFCSRDCVKKTRFGPDGLAKVSAMALQNARDIVPLIRWNEAHGIRFFRLSSCIFPWMTSYAMEELPDWPDIQQALRAAGDLAKALGHRLTFHPSEYCKIAGERQEWVDQSVAELEVHSRMFDEMGFLPASPHNKINIHVGGAYGDPQGALARFSQVVNERLSPNCKARLTVENDDRPNLFSVADLIVVHEATGIPITFDFHHWKFCSGGQTQEEAFRAAIATWPQGVRPVVHWSESPEDPNKMRKAHSEFIDGPINLFGLEGQVDVMIEAKAKELTLLQYWQYVFDGFRGPGPRTRRIAQLEADAAAAAAQVGSDEGSGGDEETEDE